MLNWRTTDDHFLDGSRLNVSSICMISPRWLCFRNTCITPTAGKEWIIAIKFPTGMTARCIRCVPDRPVLWTDVFNISNRHRNRIENIFTAIIGPIPRDRYHHHGKRINNGIRIEAVSGLLQNFHRWDDITEIDSIVAISRLRPVLATYIQ